MLGPERQRQGVAVRAGENPGQIGVPQGVLIHQGLPSVARNLIASAAFGMVDECRMATEPGRDGLREEDLHSARRADGRDPVSFRQACLFT